MSAPAQQTAHGSTAATDGATPVAQPSPADTATAANTIVTARPRIAILTPFPCGVVGLDPAC